MNSKRNRYGFSLKYFLILIIIIFVPVGVNKLMNTTAPKFFAKDGVVISNDWIGFMGSFLGSLIAGLLTLGGVFLTIKEQRYRQNLESYPAKVLKLDNIQNNIINEHISGKLLNLRDAEGNLLAGNAYDAMSNLSEKSEVLLPLAAAVSPEIYKNIRTMLKIADDTLKSPRNSTPSNSSRIRGLFENEEIRADNEKIVIEGEKILKEIAIFESNYKEFMGKYENFFRI